MVRDLAWQYAAAAGEIGASHQISIQLRTRHAYLQMLCNLLAQLTGKIESLEVLSPSALNRDLVKPLVTWLDQYGRRALGGRTREGMARVCEQGLSSRPATAWVDTTRILSLAAALLDELKEATEDVA